MSGHKHEREPLLRNTTSLLRLLILLSFISDEVCEDIIQSCPSPFNEGTIEKINCSINVTNIKASCHPTPSNVLFTFSKATVPNLDLCKTSFNGTCGLQPVGDMNCSCVTSTADIHTYQLNFVGSKSAHTGGNITCNVICIPSPSVLRSANCSFLVFDSTSGSTPSSNVTDSTSDSTSTSNVTASNAPDEGSSCPKSCIIAIVISCVVAAAIVGAILGALCKMKKIRCPQCCSQCCCKKTTTNSNCRQCCCKKNPTNSNSSQGAKPDATAMKEAPNTKPSDSH